MRNNMLLENVFGGILASVPDGAHRSGDCKEISADVIAQYDRWLGRMSSKPRRPMMRRRISARC